MIPFSNWLASLEPSTQRGVTQIVTLYTTGTAPKVVAMRPGEYWLCRVPNGAATKSVQLLFCIPGETPSNADMALPTADAGAKNIISKDSTLPFIIGCDPDPDLANQKTAVAVHWNGAADSTLIMTKIRG